LREDIYIYIYIHTYMYVCINEHRLTVVHARSYISLACMKYYAQPEAQSLSRNFNPKQYRHSIKIKEK